FASDPWSTAAPVSRAPAESPSPPSTSTETTTVPAETTTTTAPPPPPVAISDVRALAMAPGSATIAWHTSEPVSSRIAYGVGTPTLWTAPAASSVRHVATLNGLTYGTSYVLSVDTQATDGRRSSAAFALQTPALDDSVHAATGGGAFLVDGQPFFPT